MFNSHCTVANARKGTVFRHQTEEKVGFCWFGNLVSAKIVFNRSRKIYLEKKKENSFGVTIRCFLFTRSGQDGSQVPQQPWMSVGFSIPLKQENSTLTAPRSFNLASMHMAYMQFCISDLIFHMDFLHFQLLGNLTTRKVAICANSDINRLFINVQLFKCSSSSSRRMKPVSTFAQTRSVSSHTKTAIVSLRPQSSCLLFDLTFL